jgi:hypothetical protein
MMAPSVARDNWRIEAAALDWVRQNFEHFKPQTHSDPKRVGFVTKAAAELAMICGLATTTELGTRATPYRELAGRVWEDIFRNDAVQDYLILSPGDVPSLGFYGSMRQCGFEDLRYREQIVRILDSGYPRAIERPPSSELDFVFSLRLAGFDAPDMEGVYRRSMLAHHPPPHALTTNDVYTITHAIFFSTDFGRSNPGFFTSADRHNFTTAHPRLTGYYLRSNDWDLTSELLITLCATGTRSQIVPTAWEILSGAQNPDGSYMGPSNGKPAADLSSDPEWIAFRDNYHTTLAVLLALVTAPPD